MDSETPMQRPLYSVLPQVPHRASTASLKVLAITLSTVEMLVRLSELRRNPVFVTPTRYKYAECSSLPGQTPSHDRLLQRSQFNTPNCQHHKCRSGESQASLSSLRDPYCGFFFEPPDSPSPSSSSSSTANSGGSADGSSLTSNPSRICSPAASPSTSYVRTKCFCSSWFQKSPPSFLALTLSASSASVSSTTKSTN